MWKIFLVWKYILGIQIANMPKHSANVLVHGQYIDDTNMIYELV